ncbi:MAG: polysaccharide deacetylase family protein [Cyclobacteriaceae bacterium]|nr:polysaccharide deacetylase family protein [Cyclobacteriaceae bacterium]
MMRFVFRGMSKVIAMLGIHHFVRFLKRHKTSFILYHDPDPIIFRKHIAYLSKRYSIISLDDFLTYQKKPNAKLPDYSMVITFDDGHKGNFQLLETLATFNIKPTVYVCTGIVTTNRKFWFKLSGIPVGSMKKLNNQERLEQLKQLIDFSPEMEFSINDRDALSQEEIRQLNQYIDFQSHTHFHPILTTCDEATANAEIVRSRSELSKIVSNPVLHFAYPNGDYSKREIALLKQAGYQSARTTDVGWNVKSTDPFRLKITGVSDRAPLWMLKAELTGIPGYFYNLYKSGISLRSIRGLHEPERNPT